MEMSTQQANYDNLQAHHALLIKQACRLARLLKFIADENKSKYSSEAAEMIKAFEDEVPF